MEEFYRFLDAALKGCLTVVAPLALGFIYKLMQDFMAKWGLELDMKQATHYATQVSTAVTVATLADEYDIMVNTEGEDSAQRQKRARHPDTIARRKKRVKEALSAETIRYLDSTHVNLDVYLTERVKAEVEYYAEEDSGDR